MITMPLISLKITDIQTGIEREQVGAQKREGREREGEGGRNRQTGITTYNKKYNFQVINDSRLYGHHYCATNSEKNYS